MSNLSENFKNSYKNFKQYAKHGTVPAVTENNSQVPQNCFYKSVYYIDSVVGPMKDMLGGVDKNANTSETLGNRKETIKGRAHNVFYSGSANLLLFFYTGFAYLMYLPKKLFSYLKGTGGPKSLVDYGNDWQHTAEKHGGKCADFFSALLSYAISAVIWTVALAITPITWAVDKVSSKLDDMKAHKNTQEQAVTA